MQKILRICLPIMLLLSLKGFGQDEHFTNFRMAPLAVNPALTGSFNGTYRLTAVYRGQWNNVSGPRNPHISVDLPILAGLLTENDWIGVGLAIVTTIDGSANYTKGFAGTSATYHLGLDKNYDRVFSVGFQYGSQTARVNRTDKLIFPSQLYGQAAETLILDMGGQGDGVGTQSVSNGAVSIGATYKAKLNKDGDLWRGGIAMKGIGSNNGSFVSTLDSIQTTNTKIMSATFTAFGEASLVRSEKVRINPAVIFERNRQSTNFSIQTTADYLLSREKRQIVTGGLGYRLGDSVHLLAGIQIKDVKVGLAYDITTSGFSGANPGGAFELSVSYIGKVYKKPIPDNKILCPRL